MNLAEALNLGCLCRTLNPERLRQQLETDPSLQGMLAGLATTHPHLFSETAVFLDPAIRATLGQAIAAIEGVIALPAYQQAALASAPGIARQNFGPAGVFMAYDFHLGADGPRLIEINTNAGGALLNAALARAHRECCEPMQGLMDAASDLTQIDQTFVDMFRAEWQAQRGAQPLRSVLIVDDAPEDQYLAPEFALARQLFLAHGITAAVGDARELIWKDGALWHPVLPGAAVDLVYNRLTDFSLAEPAHEALRSAYVASAAVVTPHPRAHALYADKRNLITLGDDALLASWGVSAEDRRLLQAVVPHTELVTADHADDLWARRRQLFFKPVAGYGAKAAYRGDKLTRGVWSTILAGGFIAQALVPPSERLVDVDGVPTRLKLDIRAYTYRGQVQLLAARTYTGQTTNFRTAGGGFSPVVVLPSAMALVADARQSPPHADGLPSPALETSTWSPP
ncbi:MAG: hypothetical protein Q7U63_20385 [Polaromonas sp.]|uniref:hypothetical protein n=1 Tax=Polaromonas sp. TaxID=1869339 RepID=UPI00271CF99A|nr:hypothetical protein [Polaromonas sp.]MDO9116147.1 hypothetical protein [Polaromonas sp.]MDP1887805.1 hypothetical protein [Polaromonas sp.]